MVIESTNCRPMPGRAKICSMTKDPVTRFATTGPSTVTTGNSELRRPCLKRICPGFSPLARAVVM
ncbi:hypothetical protein D3C71_2071890 [compost metagenome]